MKLELSRSTELELSELASPGFHLHGDAEGEGFAALQMFAASIALCSASVLVGYAEQVLHVPVDPLRITTRWDYADEPYRVARVELNVHWPGLPESRREAVRRAVESCTIHRTLEHPPELISRVETHG